VPRKLSILLEALFWIVSVLIIVSGFYNFEYYRNFKMVIIFFVISTTLMIIIASMMFYALYKMKKTIEQMPRMKKGINVKRMINHSIAYIIYNSTYLIDTIIYIFGDVERKEEMASYVAWLIITVAALFS